MRSFFTTAGLLAGLLALVSCADQQKVARKDVLDTCASCHGATGISSKYYVPHLAGQNYAYLKKQLLHFGTVDETGDARKNPTMNWHAARVNETNIDRIARYYSEQTCAQGIYKWIGAAPKNICISCHGAQGRSSDPNIPNLAGQRVTYMQRQWSAFQNTLKGTPNKNADIHRSSKHMEEVVEDGPGGVTSALYYFNSLGCRQSGKLPRLLFYRH